MRDHVDPGPSAVLRAGLAHSGMTEQELFRGQFALGGTVRRTELDAALEGRTPLTTAAYDRIAGALNDHFVDRGLGHVVPYHDELRAVAE